MDLKEKIRSIPDFPIEGVLFRDITTLMRDKEGFSELINQMADRLKGQNIDVIVGPEARGFCVGSALAYALGCGFVVARKPGKMPCETIQVEYGLEYGSATLEIDAEAIKPGMRAAIVDDMLATGGTALAVAKIIEQMGGEVAAFCFAMELPSEFNARELLKDYQVHAIMSY